MFLMKLLLMLYCTEEFQMPFLQKKKNLKYLRKVKQ